MGIEGIGAMERSSKTIGGLMYVLGQSSVFAAVVLMVFASFWVLDFDPLNLLGLDRAIQWGGPAAIDPRSAPKYIIYRSIVTGIAAAILSIALFSIFRRIVIALSKARIAERDHPRETKPFLEPNGEELIEFPRADGVSVVVANIGQRISLLQRRANQIYWTILGTLIVGVVLLIFAGSLSSIDSTSTTILNSVYSQRLDALQNLQRLQDFARRESQFSAGAGPTSGSDSRSVGNPFAAAIGQAQIQFDTADSTYGKVLDAVLKSAGERTVGERDIYSSGTVLRIGVVGMLVFLTQILVSLFRYNSRLIAFYSAKRDALVLSSGRKPEFKDIADLLLPRGLDFGREPRHPFAEVGGLLSRLGGRLPVRATNNRGRLQSASVRSGKVVEVRHPGNGTGGRQEIADGTPQRAT